MLSWIASCLLYAFGWRIAQHDLKMYKQLHARQTRAVFVFPHTSMFDAVLYILFHWAHRLPMCAPILYTWLEVPILGRVLRHLGFLPLRGKRDGGGGMVSSLVEAIRKTYTDRGFALWINPEGSRFKQERWGSGFYHIAKCVGAKIYTGSLDYETHTLHIECCDSWDPTVVSYEDTEKALQNRLSHFIPRYPDQVFPPVCRTYKHVSFVDLVMATNMCMLLPVVGFVWQLGLFHPLVWLLLYSSVLSTRYHHIRESDSWTQQVESMCVKLTALAMLCTYGHLLDFFGTASVLVSLYTFYMGSGRHPTKTRSVEYICYHSLFHLQIMLLGFYILK